MNSEPQSAWQRKHTGRSNSLEGTLKAQNQNFLGEKGTEIIHQDESFLRGPNWYCRSPKGGIKAKMVQPCN
jgi:hypothetical protein